MHGRSCILYTPIKVLQLPYSQKIWREVPFNRQIKIRFFRVPVRIAMPYQIWQIVFKNVVWGKTAKFNDYTVLPIVLPCVHRAVKP